MATSVPCWVLAVVVLGCLLQPEFVHGQSTCPVGRYGSTCQFTCAANCRNGCNQTTGICSSCNTGYYGDNCDMPCPSGCDATGCSQSNGVCLSGCVAGMFGDYCQTPCACPAQCDRVTGKCDCSDYLHCMECNSGGCTQCSSQFRSVYQGHCCSIGCGTDSNGFRPCRYDTDYSCIRFNGACDQGFYGTTCEACSSPLPNCAECEVGADPSSRSADCMVCEQGYTLTENMDCCNQLCDNECRDLIPNCGTCHEIGSDVICDSCISNAYSIKTNGKCCGANCEDCVNGQCLTCTAGYGPYPGRDSCDLCSMHCQPKADGSARCDASTRRCLTSCEFGWHDQNCDTECTIANCYECGYFDTSSFLFCSVCNNGYYGQRCDPCNENCIDGRCNNVTGECLIGCKDGFWGQMCENSVKAISGFANCATSDMSGQSCLTCDPGFYGLTCSENCSTNCVPNSSGAFVCDKNTASCDFGCQPGWHIANCNNKCGYCRNVACNVSTAVCLNEACLDGFYLPQCTATCNSNCAADGNGNRPCDVNSGRCTLGCVAGFYGDRCTAACSPQCSTASGEIAGRCNQDTGNCILECTPGYYDLQCRSECVVPCVDNTCNRTVGTCDECSKPNPGYLCATGACPVGFHGKFCNNSCADNCADGCDRGSRRCNSCVAGWFGATCDVECGHCEDVSCSQDGGICDGGCVDGFFRLNCTSPCPDTGCAVCQIDTGLCNECKQGLYGVRCNSTCSSFCSPSAIDNLVYCNKDNGNCLEGSCVDGYYGAMCSRQCPPNCQIGPTGVGTCDFTTGTCAAIGCKDGWYGDQCQLPCSSSCATNVCERDGRCTDGCIETRYGPDCKIVCNTTCNDNTCDRNDGYCKECDLGAEATPLCRTADCPAGWHGLNCDMACAANCLNSLCNRYTDMCLACVDGYYGRNCENDCGRCADGRCDQNTGVCSAAGCEDGYYNDHCTQPCLYEGCLSCSRITGQCIDCEDGRFGRDCNRSCSQNCAAEPVIRCTKDVGHCIPERCNPGYYGSNCNSVCSEKCGLVDDSRQCDFTSGTCLAANCESNYFGPSCLQQCSSTCVNQDCHRNGTCRLGCNVGWYGDRCELPCAVATTCNDNTCDRVTGICEECNAAQPRPLCRTAACPVGIYGLFCNETCPRNCEGNLCDRNTGLCIACIPGYYGGSCGSSCPNCAGDNTCFKESGICQNGCDNGFFRLHCNQTCLSEGCLTCDRDSGKCILCKDGRYGDNCTSLCSNNCRPNITTGTIQCEKGDGTCREGACQPGFWHPRCVNTCSQHCSGVTCDLYSGQCSPCNIGHFGTMCSETCSARCRNSNCELEATNCREGCAIGYFGDRCQNNCSVNCVGLECEKDGGTCSNGCNGNTWYGLTCNQRCNANCVNQRCSVDNGRCLEGCAVGTFGDQCQYNCSSVSKCNDGTCDRVSGQCAECNNVEPGPNCPSAECGANLRGINCDEQCPSRNCLFGRCQRYEDECIGCVSGLYGRYCNMSCTNCRGDNSCEQYSGECLQGCVDGFYGAKCNQPCNSNCQSCARSNGACLSCKPGRWGESCENTCSANCQQVTCDKDTGRCAQDVCRPGYYGERCDLQCSANCRERTPDGVSLCLFSDGTCSGGCLDTYYGSKCLERCSTRCLNQLCTGSATTCDLGCIATAWGPDCSRNCSANCRIGTCDVTGKCDEGCRDGYYGNNCSATCVVPCRNGICDRPSGICDACKTAIIGEQCPIQVCDSGFYGAICDTPCPGRFCFNNTCARHSGLCSNGCLQNYYGEYCTQRCNCDSAGSLQCNTDGTCQCRPGYHGTDCSSTCSEGCMENECDQRTGACTSGCRAGYYRASCTGTCPHCLNQACNGADGTCPQCENGYYGIGCNSACLPACLSCSQGSMCEQCANNRWGDICENTCSDNCAAAATGRLCSKSTGSCTAGCISRYWGPTCSSTCGNCANGICDRITGQCSGDCSAGFYGASCELSCSEHCAAVRCSKPSGQCEGGCRIGWYGTDCQSECSSQCRNKACSGASRCTEGCTPGYYGLDCTLRCANCRNQNCSVNGVCGAGCNNGFFGSQCDINCLETCLDGTCDIQTGSCAACSLSPKGAQCRTKDAAVVAASTGELSTDAIAGIAGGAAGAFVIIFVALVIICVMCRRKDEDVIQLPPDLIERLSVAPSLHGGSVSTYPTARVVGEDALADKDFVLF